MGFVQQEFFATSRQLRQFSTCLTAMPLTYYQERFRSGAIQREDIELAIDELVESGVSEAELLTGHCLVGLLEQGRSDDRLAAEIDAEQSIKSISSRFDAERQTDWTATIHNEISKHCSAYYDQGQSLWKSPWKERGLYSAWRSAMRHDRNLEIQGLNRIRDLVKGLPDQPEAAVARLMTLAQVPEARREDYLLCLAYEMPGWSAWAQYQSRWVKDGQARVGDGVGNDLVALLAIRLAYDVAVSISFSFTPAWPADKHAESRHGDAADLAEPPLDVALYALQRAHEIGYRNRLLADLRTKSPAGLTQGKITSTRKLAQLVFCIDVRSERIRRLLESADERIETLGFAGFFGLPIRVKGLGEQRAVNQLPVLVPPRIDVQEEIRLCDDEAQKNAASRKAFIHTLRRTWKSFQVSAVSAYAFVETTGLFFGLKLAIRSLGWVRGAGASRSDGMSRSERQRLAPSLAGLAQSGLSTADQANLAASILRGMGLTRDFSKLVVFCGHGCQTENNPLKAGLDCGACGGHSGEPNARLAAQLMNAPDVRASLQTLGIDIPRDVHFVAALHNTTTDEIAFLDEDLVPDTHLDVMAEVKNLARRASAETRAERRSLIDSSADKDLFRRARDWSEVRPEWGLTGNAAFIAGPRQLTEAVNLAGRAFLHNYDHTRDPDGQILEVILTAPMVVASWINLQYFASTVDQRNFGSGNKTIHNVVGRFGVFAGNAGDLKTGLPWESLHDGQSYRHDPLRLLAVIAAPRASIASVLNRHQSVHALARNGWIHLVAYEGGEFYRLTHAATWEPIAPPSSISSKTHGAVPVVAGV